MKRIFAFLLALMAVITFAVPTAYAADNVLLSKVGALSRVPAENAAEVVGFNYLERVPAEDYCVSFYSANPPLIGMTPPVKTPCLYGIRDIGEYQIGYKEAVDIFEQLNCGGAFESISLSWPLTPEVTEPIWRFFTNLGSEVTIGANTGDVNCR